MTLRELREVCKEYPELSALWTNLTLAAFAAEIVGLPLSLIAHDGEKLAPEQVHEYRLQYVKFRIIAAQFICACKKYGVSPPELSVADICSLI